MRSNFFFNGSWIAQIVVGLGLFACSFFIEYNVLTYFVSPPSLAFFLAITLEGGKITAIIWHYYLSWQASGIYPSSIRIFSFVFRAGLFCLSLLCSMLFLTSHLDRPNLEKVKAEKVTLINHQIEQEVVLLQKQSAIQRADQLEHQEKETEALASRYDERINTLEGLLLNEMDNVVNGIFKGKRHDEFERQVDKEKDKRNKSLSLLQQRHREQLREISRAEAVQLDRLQQKGAGLRENLAGKDLDNIDIVHDKRIVALLKTIESIFDYSMFPLQFVFYFSILISLLMEIGIMLSFATITIALAPVLHTRHVEELEKEACRVRSESTITQDDIRHNAAVDRTRKAGERVTQAANDLLYPQAVA